MLQARIRGEKQWYRPDRDLLNAFKPLMLKTLSEFGPDAFGEGKIPQEEYEKYVEIGGELAKLLNGVAARTLTPKGIGDELDALIAKRPYVMASIMRQFFVQTLVMYNQWVLETVPETEDGHIARSTTTLP